MMTLRPLRSKMENHAATPPHRHTATQGTDQRFGFERSAEREREGKKRGVGNAINREMAVFKKPSLACYTDEGNIGGGSSTAAAHV